MLPQQRSFFVLAFLCSTLLFFGCPRKYVHDTPENLGKSLLAMLTLQDVESMPKIIPSEEDFMAFLDGAEIPENEKKLMEEEMKAIMGEFDQNSRKAFHRVTDEISRDGVILKRCKFVKSVADTRQGPDNMVGTVTVTMEYEGDHYELFIDDAGEVASGWVLGRDAFSWKGQVK